MTDLVYRRPSIIPATLEDAQWLEEQGERERAMERGDWLPDGWEWVEDDHYRVPRDGLGAWDREHNILVYVRPPEWSCWKCGTTDRLASPCLAADFLDEEGRSNMFNEWGHKRRDETILQLHGIGAPKVIFDMVWNRFLHRLWSSRET